MCIVFLKVLLLGVVRGVAVALLEVVVGGVGDVVGDSVEVEGAGHSEAEAGEEGEEEVCCVCYCSACACCCLLYSLFCM